ncbi:MAG: hypothetical protein ACTSP4_11645 [Candidatus Hodarchaeales archaeon]
MAVEYGMSLVSELKETLARRRNVLEQFELYKRMYDVLIKELQETFDTDEKTVCSALFLSRFVMDGIGDEQKRVSEIARTRMILENIIRAREHIPVDLGSLIATYQLIYEVAMKIEKELVENVRLLIKRPVIMTNLVDIYVIPLFSLLKQISPSLDLRWAMAELYGALTKTFASKHFENFKQGYPLKAMDHLNYFDAGSRVIKDFMDGYLREKFDKEELEEYGDIGAKEHEYACSVFYNLDSREVFLKESVTDRAEMIDTLKEQLQASLHINHPTFRENCPFKLLFAHFFVQLNINNKKVERHFYIHNHEENSVLEGNLGTWNYLVLSSESVNHQSIDGYARQRCMNIKGLKNKLLQQPEKSDDVDYVLQAWNETYIHNLQQEYNFLSEKDTRRDQGFQPLAIFKQEHGESEVEAIIESQKGMGDRSLRATLVDPSMETFNLISPENVISILEYVKYITAHGYNVLRSLLFQQQQDIEVVYYPVEFLYEKEYSPEESQEFPGIDIILQFSTDENRIAGIIGQNENSLKWKGKSLKRRQIASKINQLLTALRIKSLEDARYSKLEEYLKHGQGYTSDVGKFWLSGKIDEEAEIIMAKKVVDDRIKEAKREELLRLQALRQNYFNDVIIKHFYDSVNLDLQQKALQFLIDRFKVVVLEKEKNVIDRQQEHMRNMEETDPGMPEEMIIILNGLSEKIVDRALTSFYEIESDLMKLKALVSKMTEEEIMRFF